MSSIMSKLLFKDPEQQAAFDRDGFVVQPLLEPADVEELVALYHHYFPEVPPRFFSSSYLGDFSLKKEISTRVTEIVSKNFDKVFRDYRFLGAAFLSKAPGRESEMPMHQDWTIVDESEHVALNIWTPLIDADETNGTLEVLKGSHAYKPALRAPTLPFPFEGFQDCIRPHLTPVPVKAGTAVILNQAVVHASKPNMTDQLRIAVTTGLVSNDAPLVFHYYDKMKGKQELEQIAQDDDFLLYWENFFEDIFQRPRFGTTIGTIPYQHPKWEQQELLGYIHRANGTTEASASPDGEERQDQAVRSSIAAGNSGAGAGKETGEEKKGKGFLQRLFSKPGKA